MPRLLVRCIVTNKEKYLAGSTLQNRLNKFGSEDNIQRYYVSKEAGKLLKKGHSVEQVRKDLNIKDFDKAVDMEVLFKLKLLKRGKRKKNQLSADELRIQQLESEKNEREYYELKEKMSSCFKTWVEWATGGPGGKQVQHGGTCIRPDIYYDNEGNRAGRCKPCAYHEFCLCSNKEVV